MNLIKRVTMTRFAFDNGSFLETDIQHVPRINTLKQIVLNFDWLYNFYFEPCKIFLRLGFTWELGFMTFAPWKLDQPHDSIVPPYTYRTGRWEPKKNLQYIGD